MKKLILTLISLYILSGCATTAQNQLNQMNAQLNAVNVAGEKCYTPINNSPLGQRLQERFIVDARDPRSVEKLTITGYATEQEMNDILEYSAIRKPCQNQALEGLGQVHPEYRAMFARHYAEADADLVRVIKMN